MGNPIFEWLSLRGKWCLSVRPSIPLRFWFLLRTFQPFHKSLGSLPKNRALPRGSSTSNSSRPISRPLQSLSKTFPGWFLSGCNFNEARTRFEIKFWEIDPPKSPYKLFGSCTLLHSYENSQTQELSAVKQKRKPSQAAAAGKSKEKEERTKGRVRETEGRQRDASLADKAAATTSSGHTLFET